MSQEIELQAVMAYAWAFAISVFAIPSIIHLAHIKNLLDEPNFRTVHHSLTPRLGGLAIFAGFISAIFIFGQVTPPIQKIIAGCMLLFFIGLKDDIMAISPFKKFFVQILSTSILVFLGDVRVTSFQGFLGIYELSDGISYGFTMLAIIGITNAVNLIDGLDGLAGSLTIIICATFGFFFYYNGNVAMAIMAFSLIGAVTGFLRYNIHKAIIFMGDTGSLVCGYLISVFAVEFIEMGNIDSAPSIATAILMVPLFDTIRVFGLRIMKGKSPFSPDRNHVHHVLTRFGLSQLATVMTLVAINALVIMATISLAPLGDNVLLYALLGFFVLTCIVLELMRRASDRRAPKPAPVPDAASLPAPASSPSAV